MSRPELAEWMTPVDYDILRTLQNEGNQELTLTPRTISANTNWTRSAVDSHLRTLRDNGLVEYQDEEKSLYQLSDRGRAWLEGELSTEALENDD